MLLAFIFSWSSAALAVRIMCLLNSELDCEEVEEE